MDFERWLRTCSRFVPGAMIGGAVLWWTVIALAILRSPGQGADFSTYFRAALALRDNPHANIYDFHVIQAVALAHQTIPPAAGLYLYPPVLAALFLPLTALSYEAARLIWAVFGLLCWVASAAVLVDLLRSAVGENHVQSNAGVAAPRGKARLLAAASRLIVLRRGVADTTVFALAAGLFMALTYMPLAFTMGYGEVNALILVYIVLAPWLLRRGRPEVAGALLGLAAAIKVYPLLLIAYYVLRGRWRVVTGALAIWTLCGVLLLGVTGLEGIASMRYLLTNGGHQALLATNEALVRVPVWITLELGGTPGTLDSAIGYILVAFVGLAFVAGVFASRWRLRRAAPEPVAIQRSGEREDLLGYAWAACTMILVAPITWAHHDTWLLLPFAVCLGGVLRELHGGFGLASRRRWLALGCLAAVLAGYALTMSLLPFRYDLDYTFNLGPYVFGHPIRPFFMVLRPLATTLTWTAAGLLYLRSTGMLPVGLRPSMTTSGGARAGVRWVGAMTKSRTAAGSAATPTATVSGNVPLALRHGDAVSPTLLLSALLVLLAAVLLVVGIEAGLVAAFT